MLNFKEIMRKRKNTKRTITKLLLALLVTLTLFTGFAALSFAQGGSGDWCNYVKENTGGWIGCGEEEISFTKFKGGYTPPVEEGYSPGLTRVTDARSFIRTFVNFATGFLGLIAVSIIIYGGFLYVTAAGEQEKTDKGKKAIQYALVGIIIILASFALVNTLITEPFEEGNIIDGDNDSDASGDGLGDGVLGGGTSGQTGNVVTNPDGSVTYTTSFNPLASQVQTAATNLVSLYQLYKEILVEVDNLEFEYEQPTLLQGGFNSIIKYLNSVESKLSRIETKFPPLSKTKEKIIQTKTEAAGTINRITWKKNLPLGEDEDEEEKAGIIANMFINNMNNIYLNNANVNGSFDAIRQAAKEDLIAEIDRSIETLIGRAAQNGLPAKQGIKDSIPFSMEEHRALIDTLAGQYGLGKLKLDLPNGDNAMLTVLQLYQEVFQSLRNIQFVKASISADVVQGNAPLVVNFNMLNSVDPTGESIGCEQIFWNLTNDGTLGFNECGDNDSVGNGFTSYVYTEPGTYQATVTINSRDPNRFAPGKATVPIKVLPATAQIRMNISDLSENKSKDMVIYSAVNPGKFLFDNESIKFTADEAKAGIKFNPTGTTSGEGTQNVIEVYHYDFGDGVEETYNSLNAAQITHQYAEAGTYEVKFEVVDDKGNKNRKIFDIIIGSPVARINASPNQNVFIGEEVSFNATSSSSQVGQITSYEWSIFDENDAEVALDADYKNAESFKYTFDKHGKYKVFLTVNDSLGDPDQDRIFIDVTSKEPISKFDYSIPQDNQPSTIKLSGIKSYDPDGDIKDPTLNYEYIWSIEPNDENNYTNIDPAAEPDPSSYSSANRTVRFNKKGEYQVSFLVKDSQGQGEAFEQTITIDDLLDVAWEENPTLSNQLNSEGRAKMTFKGLSNFGKAYEIDFGDGEFEGGEIVGGTFQADHFYTEAGKYKVTFTVFDEEDNSRSISRQIYIGDATKPVAAIRIFVDGVEVENTDDEIEANRTSVITFDAGESRNIDGTKRRLLYSWDFDDTTISTKRSTTHTYKELPAGSGYYEVELIVTNEKDQKKKDDAQVKIYILSEEPELLGLNAIPQGGDNLETPVRVKVSAIGAEDKDGQIIKYRWYYYNIANSSEELGVQITESPVAFLNIGGMGQPGKKQTYRFGVELTDNENNVLDSGEILNNDEIPQVTVTNGPNEAPTAKFSVDKTSIMKNDTINFTSSSTDSDGEIVSYVWDFEGDGFSNNTATNKSSVSKKYTSTAANGIDVRLKVIDDKFGEAISNPVRIYVNSQSEPPTAAFTYSIVGDKKVQFHSNSKTNGGPSIKKYKWDFDASSNLQGADADGDGLKDNDDQSSSSNANWTYPDYGVFKAKLTVIDADGNEDSVTNTVNIPEPDKDDLPKAAFKVKKVGPKTVEFINNSSKMDGSSIVKYIWDFDTQSNYDTADSDGDGFKDNDQDSTAFEPDFTYPEVDKFSAKLTVINQSGNQDDVVNEIDLEAGTLSSNEDNNTTNSSSSSPLNNNSNTGPNYNFDGSGGPIKARLSSNPPISKQDGKIHMLGETGNITFDFSKSSGPITQYVLDKNIFFDTDGNGVPNDDVDAEGKDPGTWTTNFAKEWGKIVVKLTVYDASGNSDSELVEVVFTSPFGVSVFGTDEEELLTALVVLLAFVILSGVVYRFQKHKK